MQDNPTSMPAPIRTDRLLTAEWFPAKWNERDQEFAFYLISPEMLRSSRFAGDSRFIRTLKPLGFRSMGDLLTTRMSEAKNAVHLHLIFHMAYCCSTLLARYLEQSARHLVFKEPSVTSSFALTVRECSERNELKLLTILCLLNRGFPGQDLAVVKFNVFENILANDMVRIYSSATATYIIHCLDACIASILKFAWRVDKARAWNMNIYRWAYHRSEKLMKPDSLDDVQTVAFWWLINIKLMNELRVAYGSRVSVVTANEIAEDPKGVLIRLSSFSGMERIRDRITEMLESGASKEYSKIDGKGYDLEDRKKDMNQSLLKFKDEGLRARQWLLDNFSDAMMQIDPCLYDLASR